MKFNFAKKSSSNRASLTPEFRRLMVLLVAMLFAASMAACSDDSGSGSNEGIHGHADQSTISGDTSGGPNQGHADITTSTSHDHWSGPDAAADTSSPGADMSSPGGNTNVNLGGSQDFGYFRRLLDDGIVPDPSVIDAGGFFAEHHTPLPTPDCGDNVCLQAMLGVMGNLINGNNCTLLNVGLNSPLTPDPENRPPLQLTVVVDVSGSMDVDGKLAFVRQGLTRMVNELVDGDRIAIVTYSDDANLVFPMSDVSGSRNELADIVSNLRALGGTNIYDGLDVGYGEAFDNYDSGRQNRVLLLSDGVATQGFTDSESILALSRGFNSDGVGLTTVGLGTNFNFELMRGLAEQADGNFYFVEDSAAVDEVFQQEISYFTVPVAFDVEITLEQGEHYQYLRSTGSNLWEDGTTGGQISVPSVFLAHRESHSDVEPGGGRRGGGSALLIELMPLIEEGDISAGDVSRIHLSYREPGTNEIKEQTINVEYPFAPWYLAEEGFFQNDIVTKNFVMLNILVALEESTLRFHNGDMPGAIGLLRRVIAAANDYEDSANGGEGDVDIVYDIELMEQLIDVMIQNGASEPSPEETDIPEDPWPAD